jgi:hypothetical protein
MENTTPETLNFLFLGLGSVVLFVVGYIVTIWTRHRNLQKDVELIRELAADE